MFARGERISSSARARKKNPGSHKPGCYWVTIARVAATAARSPRVGRTEGKARRTFSVARNLGPARGASATTRTPRAGSAVSRGVATPATLDIEAETEAIAALALNRGRSVRLERRLRVLQRSTGRGALGSFGRKARDAPGSAARRVLRDDAPISDECFGLGQLSLRFSTRDSRARTKNQTAARALPVRQLRVRAQSLASISRRVGDVRAENSPNCK